MSRNKRKQQKRQGWEIIVQENPALGRTRYRVVLPGWSGRNFDNYDAALEYYHEKTGWSTTEVLQP